MDTLLHNKDLCMSLIAGLISTKCKLKALHMLPNFLKTFTRKQSKKNKNRYSRERVL